MSTTGGGSSGGGAKSTAPPPPSIRATRERFRAHFDEWMRLEETNLQDLQNALYVETHATDGDNLESLVEKNLKDYEDYGAKRSELAREDPLPLFSPSWCSTLERCFLWIAGCRPTMQIRLVYALSGLDFEAQGRLEEFLRGVRRGDMREISGEQLSKINDLHVRTIGEEERLTRRMALLEEELTDNPFVALARKKEALEGDKLSNALRPSRAALTTILEDTDRLRLDTVKQIVGVLTPLQAVEFLIAAKQIRLAVRDWGMKSDEEGGSGS